MAVGGSGCQDKRMGETTDKAERLAAALRENLKRRKAQARVLEKSPLAKPRPPDD